MSTRRATHTTTEQCEAYVAFLEHNEQFALGEFDTTMSKETEDEKWEELSQILNCCERGPSRTVRVWKIALSQWKKKVMEKSRKSKKRSAGGSLKHKLRDVEVRALIQWERRAATTSTADQAPVPSGSAVKVEDLDSKERLQAITRATLDLTPEVLQHLQIIAKSTESIANAITEQNKINAEYVEILSQSMVMQNQ